MFVKAVPSHRFGRLLIVIIKYYMSTSVDGYGILALKPIQLVLRKHCLTFLSPQTVFYNVIRVLIFIIKREHLLKSGK